MASGGHDQIQDYPRKQTPQQQITHNQKCKLKLLVIVILTNLLTIYLLTGPFNLNLSGYTNHLSPSPWDSNSLLHELNSTTSQLAASHSIIAELHQKLNSTNLLVQALLIDLTSLQDKQFTNQNHKFLKLAIDDLSNGISNELMLAIGPHKLPLGYSPRMRSDEVQPPVGAGCLRFQKELAQYMTYDIGGECPVDDVFSQMLMLKGCEPLPRRRCHPKSPTNYVEPKPVPDSIWETPPDTSIIWDPYSCKSYQCLIERRKKPGYYDCKDCFHLQGREKNRWLFDNGGLDFGIDQILETKPHGTIRIGLDIGGGTGTFAARMRERNITIITSTMNLDGPFNSFIAWRGLIPMHLSISQRLPFFENTLDIVHSMHVLSNWIPDVMLEFTLYDIYRVLRPGGLFWLDRFFCLGQQLNQTYVPMLNRIGFNKLRWNAAMKLDRGIQRNEWYFSALLEKPMT
ncbi:S-adenosyl-L-methionine-dependent methyltransferase superfamily protein [Quillaja saponaria]|uniref:S-adenosyl-L-methionine-dependent methyltransferase superfamily protein n=1 Tax=Quillaja saponaria TaxID=32244 RepID=A0AAD7KWN7_QUISA|nr:S-adenosyl-L-methionine-dependent methyltransferase superfamily protein [Quillaja saponaria]